MPLHTQDSCIPHYLSGGSWGWAISPPPDAAVTACLPTILTPTFQALYHPLPQCCYHCYHPTLFITMGNVVAMFIRSSDPGIPYKGPSIPPCSLSCIPLGKYCLLSPHELMNGCQWLHSCQWHYSHPCLLFHHPAMGITMVGFFYIKILFYIWGQ